MNEAKPTINVTPLIDVLLVLLIIFMVVSPLKPSDFKAKLPRENKDDTADANIHTLVVAVKNDSTLKLNNEKISGNVEDNSALIERLTEVFRERKENSAFNAAGDKIEKTVFVKAPRNISYGKVIKIIDAIKIAGADPISLQLDDLE